MSFKIKKCLSIISIISMIVILTLLELQSSESTTLKMFSADDCHDLLQICYFPNFKDLLISNLFTISGTIKSKLIPKNLITISTDSLDKTFQIKTSINWNYKVDIIDGVRDNKCIRVDWALSLVISVALSPSSIRGDKKMIGVRSIMMNRNPNDKVKNTIIGFINRSTIPTLQQLSHPVIRMSDELFNLDELKSIKLFD